MLSEARKLNLRHVATRAQSRRIMERKPQFLQGERAPPKECIP